VEQTENNKVSVGIAIFTILFTGMHGFIAFLFLIALTKINLGKDAFKNHGLSSGSSRLGGVGIFLSVFLGIGINIHLSNKLTLQNFISELDLSIICSLIVGLIGLAEDLSQIISSITRLIVMILIVMISLYFMQDLLPQKLLMNENEYLIINPMWLFLFTVIMVTGFINAGNIADGANGLLAIIFTIFFIAIYSIQESIIYISFIVSLMTFAIYNITTGRIFLGDFGAYFLSAIVAYTCLRIYGENDVSVFYFASILVYPCFEISRSLLVRIVNRASLIHPDNNHYHNYIFSQLLRRNINNHIANSITGVGIAFFSSFPPLYLHLRGISTSSVFWVYFFIFQLLVLTISYIFLGKKKIN
jgi:UDP-GlcNAc:undecaprenyl-phosphate/decaprenyl-phosphate GlcNAc-1-phosphate transferase